jgi:glycosyltransferase involved in cell wall biosynthesis
VLRVGLEAWGLSGDLRYTGVGQYTVALVSEVARLAPDVELVAYGAPAEPRPKWLPAAVEWRPAGRQSNRRLAAIDTRLRQLDGIVRSDRVDVFHVPGVHVRPSFPPVPRLSCPVVATVHDALPLTHYGGNLPLRLRVFYRWNLARALSAGRVLTVSDDSRDQISRSTGTDPARITVIPNGLRFEPNPDPAALRRLGVATPYLLYAGSYEPRKNLGGALEAFRLVKEAGHPHRLVAVVERDSGHAPAVLAQLDRLGLAGDVTLLHSLPEPDLRALYTQAELLIFPSLAEGFGFPPLQAAACGVAVVASDLPVLRQTMEEVATFAKAGDPVALAAATLGLLDDPARRRELARRGPGRALCFGLEAFAARHLEIYRAVASPAPHALLGAT